MKRSAIGKNRNDGDILLPQIFGILSILLATFSRSLIFLGFILCCAATTTRASQDIQIGSKKFTESVILAEIATQMIRSTKQAATHRAELGGTRILWNALLGGDIDIYPEYTGTLRQEILALENVSTDLDLKDALKQRGIFMTAPLGFNNTYAVGMKKSDAQRLGIRKISDLSQHPELKLGFSNEFHQRADGWPLLKNKYHLNQKDVRGLDHDIAYGALKSGDIEVVDLYSTDAEIQYYDLAVLEDDLHVFPPYQAVFLYRAELLTKSPKTLKAVETIKALESSISATTMIALNARAKLNRVPEAQVAADFVSSRFGINTKIESLTTFQEVQKRLFEHLKLVLISMAVAFIVAVPLGIWAAHAPVGGQLILTFVGLIQTIPALALLVMLLRPLKALGLPGIGDVPAVVALFLYSLLPIVRNTYSGLRNIPLHIHESAHTLGLSYLHKLWKIDLPLASPLILAGIKTSAVINVGFATLGALVGSGGFGQPILAGIRLDNYHLILQGAIPAALLAITTDVFLEVASRKIIPRGLRS